MQNNQLVCHKYWADFVRNNIRFLPSGCDLAPFETCGKPDIVIIGGCFSSGERVLAIPDEYLARCFDFVERILTPFAAAESAVIFAMWTSSAIVLKLDRKKHVFVSSTPQKPDIFSECNRILASSRRSTIDSWNNIPVAADDEKIDNPVICRSKMLRYISTDGGAVKNGKPECMASYAFTAWSEDQTLLKTDSGLVPLVDIPGKPYKTSNNRGELLAIISAMEYMKENLDNCCPMVEVICDSTYSRDCIIEWGPGWRRTGAKRLNLDMVFRAMDLYAELEQTIKINFVHQKAHVKIRPQGQLAGFFWEMNDLADHLAGILLPGDPTDRQVREKREAKLKEKKMAESEPKFEYIETAPAETPPKAKLEPNAKLEPIEATTTESAPTAPQEAPPTAIPKVPAKTSFKSNIPAKPLKPVKSTQATPTQATPTQAAPSAIPKPPVKVARPRGRPKKNA